MSGVLVDTSIWIDHLRRGNTRLMGLLETGSVLCHPWVVGELACGNLRNGTQLLSYLSALPEARMATHSEAMTLLESRGLFGGGLGWVDLHLLASTLVTHCRLWTGDGALRRVADQLGISLSPG